MVTLDAEDAHHLRAVLHAQAGQKIAVLDGLGQEWPATLTEIGKTKAAARLGEPVILDTEPTVKITVAQALPKMAEKMEQVLQRGTEIGASGFWAYECERSLTHLTGERQEKRQTRWAAIVKTAAEQSHRARLPALQISGSFGDVLAAAKTHDLALLAHEGEQQTERDAQTRAVCPAAAAANRAGYGRPGRRVHGRRSPGRAKGRRPKRLARPAHSANGNGGAGDGVSDFVRAGDLAVFVDIHNHILPGVDDGAQTMAEALAMAWVAVADGTDTMLATPHRGWFLRRPARPEVIRERVAELQTALNEAEIPLTVLPGVEIKIGPHVAQDLLAGEVGTLGEAGRWALVEPPFERIPPDALDNLKAVQDAGFQIVIAHPERCADIQRSLAFLEACADLGMAFQITTGSLLGRFGPRSQQTAEAILAHAADWPLVIASDTHDLRERPPNLMSAARDAAAALVGETLAQEMVDARPRSMVTSAMKQSLVYYCFQPLAAAACRPRADARRALSAALQVYRGRKSAVSGHARPVFCRSRQGD